MTLGELVYQIIRKAAKTDDSAVLSPSTVCQDAVETDSAYQTMFASMPTQMNEAVDIIIASKKLDFKYTEITASRIQRITKSGYPDILKAYSVEGITFRDSYGNESPIPFTDYGDYISLSGTFSDGTVIVCTEPMPEPFEEFLTMSESDREAYFSKSMADGFGLSNLACNYISCKASAKLYETVDPDYAKTEQTYADAYLGAMAPKRTTPQQSAVLVMVGMD